MKPKIVQPAVAASDTPKTPSLAYAPTTLPSRGRLYGPESVVPTPEIPGGVVEIRKMTIAEDELLASSGGSALVRLSKLIANCTKLPASFDAEKLLIADRVFLLIAIRTHTFGPNYQIQFKCRHCRHPNKRSVDVLSTLNEKPLADEIVEPFTVTLPDAGVTIGLRFTRGFDEQEALKMAKAAEARGQAATPIRDQLRQLIAEIDGEPVKNPMARIDLINRLTAVDLAAIRGANAKAEFGVDLTIYPDCERCEASNELDMPFDVDFFRPTSD